MKKIKNKIKKIEKLINKKFAKISDVASYDMSNGKYDEKYLEELVSVYFNNNGVELGYLVKVSYSGLLLLTGNSMVTIAFDSLNGIGEKMKVVNELERWTNRKFLTLTVTRSYYKEIIFTIEDPNFKLNEELTHFLCSDEELDALIEKKLDVCPTKDGETIYHYQGDSNGQF